MKATIPIAIPPGTKLLQLVYEFTTHAWILWVHHDLQMKNGTYLRLERDGGILRITLRPDGSEEHYIVRKGGAETKRVCANDNINTRRHT